MLKQASACACRSVTNCFTSRLWDSSRTAHRAVQTLLPEKHSPSRISQDSVLERMGIEFPRDGTSVPPDFVIAQRASLKTIEAVAQKLGLQESEYDLYGRFKAKV
jgi:hypothetical protein